jgi:hypothetical protein
MLPGSTRPAAFILSALIAAAALASGACGPTIDLTKGLEVLDVSSGWFDAGIVEGKNKLVPTVAFKLKNTSDQTLGMLQVNVLFRRVNDNDEWGSGFLTVAGSEGLAPGSTSQTVTVKSQLGYTGTDPREDMLHNSQFVDAKVQIFGKYGSTQWVRLAEYPITRRLITK